LHDQRITELSRELFGLLIALHGAGAARQHRHAGLAGNAAGHHLVAQALEDIEAGANEYQTRLAARAGKPRIFRKENNPRADSIDCVLLAQSDDAGDIQVSPDRLTALADKIGFVGLETVQGESVLVRVNRDGPDTQLMRRAEHPDGDLAAIRDKQSLDKSQQG